MSNIRRQINKRRKEMSGNNKKPRGIPMQIPNVGQPPQVNITEADTIAKVCGKCQGQYFETVVKLRIFPSLSLKNTSGKDVLIKMEAYLCYDCGHEYGQPVVLNDGKAE